MRNRNKTDKTVDYTDKQLKYRNKTYERLLSLALSIFILVLTYHCLRYDRCK